MYFLPKCLKAHNVPTMRLNNTILKWVDEYKYLGVFIWSDMCDQKDMNRQIRYFYALDNVLIRKFCYCEKDTKLMLFRSYSYNVYCCHLWSHFTEKQLCKVQAAYNVLENCSIYIIGAVFLRYICTVGLIILKF